MPLTNGFRITATLATIISVCILVISDFETFIFFGLPLVAGVGGSLILREVDQKRTSSDHIADIFRIYFALHLIWSSLRYWMTDLQPVIEHPIAGPFFESMTAMGLFPGVKALEGVVGIMLLANRYVPLVLVLEVPTSFTIFYLNTFITGAPRQLLTGPLELGVNCILLLLYFRYYSPFLVARAYAAPPLLLTARTSPN